MIPYLWRMGWNVWLTDQQESHVAWRTESESKFKRQTIRHSKPDGYYPGFVGDNDLLSRSTGRRCSRTTYETQDVTFVMSVNKTMTN